VPNPASAALWHYTGHDGDVLYISTRSHLFAITPGGK